MYLGLARQQVAIPESAGRVLENDDAVLGAPAIAQPPLLAKPGDVEVTAVTVNDDERKIGFMVAGDDFELHREGTMATAERMKAYRARRRRGEIRLTITLHRDDVAAIARAGYAEAATTDRRLQADEVGIFVSDAVAQIGGALRRNAPQKTGFGTLRRNAGA